MSLLRDQQDERLEGSEAQLLYALASLESGKPVTREELYKTKIWKSTRGINGEIKRIALTSISITDFMDKFFGVILDAVDMGQENQGRMNQANTQGGVTKAEQEDFNREFKKFIEKKT